MAVESKKSGWCKFIKLCATLKTEEQFSNFFNLILTHAEKEDIALRIEIISGLLRGEITQRELAKKLKISIAKISRGSNALKTIDTQIKKILQKS